ncbi:helix-turn-helix domain-containing protein [Candidatus Enterococcus murrayae]|uniref:AraC family transcriptional regulator n=1 Tax=Candidatus Enterococcus murrayae TaxID=2815321 RepID=A0ABS3HM44_9ENTE|nr:helix-turn-helix domain-containing protein [Enterococcus sp. MJM16]MBO0454513.1 AraC family transcriptional regulator [Enterococcus sp. MJM16]
MHAWEAIQKSVDYVEEHIKEELAIEELAQVSYLSLYYFQKLFSRLVGKTVNEYIKARRVANAKPLLRSTDQRIADIAFEYGFNSHETFTKAFKEIYGVTPEAYRKSKLLLTDFLKPDLSIYYTLVDEGVPLMVDDMVLEVNQLTIKETEYYTGVSKQIDSSEMNGVGVNTLIDLWDEFHEKKETIPNLLKDGVAIDYFTTAETPGKVLYFVGGSSDDSQVEGFKQIKLDPGAFYVCTFEAENFTYLVEDALYKANNYFFETWLKRHGVEMENMAPFLIQKYVNVTDDPKIEIWIKPIK